MSALVELYLKDYYELYELTDINSKLISKIDIDMALEALYDFYTPEQWNIIRLFAMGYTLREIAEIIQLGVRAIKATQISVCRAITHHLGWDYSDAKIHQMVARRLKVAKLSPEERRFVQLKLDNHGYYNFMQFNIYNFAFDVFGRVVFRK
jgi:hypothetical protein